MKNISIYFILFSIVLVHASGYNCEMQSSNFKKLLNEETLYYSVEKNNTKYTIELKDSNISYKKINLAKDCNITIPMELYKYFKISANQCRCKSELHYNAYFFKKIRKKLDIDCVSKDNKNIVSMVFFENVGLTYFEKNSIESGKFIPTLKINLYKIKTKFGGISGSMLYEPDYLVPLKINNSAQK